MSNIAGPILDTLLGVIYEIGQIKNQDFDTHNTNSHFSYTHSRSLANKPASTSGNMVCFCYYSTGSQHYTCNLLSRNKISTLHPRTKLETNCPSKLKPARKCELPHVLRCHSPQMSASSIHTCFVHHEGHLQ